MEMFDLDSLYKDLLLYINKSDLSKSINETFQAPIKSVYYNSGDYGIQHANRKGIHKGVDLRASGGTSIYPITDGIITNISNNTLGGLNISIRHNNNLKSYYAHLGTISCKIGDKVDKDTVIGTVGNSGNAINTAPHVHVEIFENGTNVNPNKYFKVPAYTNFSKKETLWLPGAKTQADQFTLDSVALINKIDKFYKNATQLYIRYDKI